ncbi:DNA mismatch repair endonuclease MutL [Membranihabitans maritimus]|uniref:DNA mismatch repair endonuclease MutL n=1 Tax=Membranihabitans maritimus TaxID=2904244 RepID=UPI001F00A2ED|nr:DNA mismatch repair endonuclease MutL [Membranihabitans maritimus]
MDSVVKMLPDNVANQIAAGEVVVRPSSVVKELMENAIDAGAKKIEVVIRDSGKGLIQVKDDGSGMNEMDARMCLERHATSKIKSGDDLTKIYTLGFRGEALPSIASVSQMEIKTRIDGEELGYGIRIEGSRVVEQDYCQAERGTSISVHNLFYNTPARRKFLKSDTVEFKHIMDEFQYMSLANPDVYFSLYHNDRLYHQLYPGSLKQRIVQIFGNHFENRLINVKETTDYLHVNGFVGKPDNAKKSRGEQFIFVNNRFIKSYYLNLAVYQAYENLIPDKSYPFFCLFIQIDPERVDVNVHPAKQEIKFEDEKFVFNIIRASVKHALVSYSVPTIDFEQNPGLLYKHKLDSVSTKESSSTSSNPPKQNVDWSRKSPGKEDWDDFYNNVKSTGEELTQGIDTQIDEIDFEEDLNNPSEGFDPIQIKSAYILNSIKSGIVIIDQKNAHERILYEQFRKQRTNVKNNSQSALFPEMIKLNAQESEAMEELIPSLKDFGFVIEPFGVKTFIIQGTPEILLSGTINKVEYLTEIISEFLEEKDSAENFNDKMAHILARNLCVRKNQVLNQQEMKQLVNQLFGCEDPTLSPSGKKCFVTFKSEDLEKLFA